MLDRARSAYCGRHALRGPVVRDRGADRARVARAAGDCDRSRSAFHAGARARCTAHADRDAPVELIEPARARSRATTPKPSRCRWAPAPGARAGRRPPRAARRPAPARRRASTTARACWPGSASPARPSSSRTTRPSLVPRGFARRRSTRFGNIIDHGAGLRRDGQRCRDDTLEILRNYSPGDRRGHGARRGAYRATRRSSRRRPTSRPGSSTPSGRVRRLPVAARRAARSSASTDAHRSTQRPATSRATSSSRTTRTLRAALVHAPARHPPDAADLLGRADDRVRRTASSTRSDIGGMVPASVSPRASEIFQEGLRLPPTKLFRAGVLNQDILDVIARQLPHPRAELGRPQGAWSPRSAPASGACTQMIREVRARRR